MKKAVYRIQVGDRVFIPPEAYHSKVYKGKVVEVDNPMAVIRWDSGVYQIVQMDSVCKEEAPHDTN